eukprot:scaffold123714_cov21-Phaeocystis_antarctica.AAC.1
MGASPDISLAERSSSAAAAAAAASAAERGPQQVVDEWAGKLVLVPAEMWPGFACNEHGGVGCGTAA